METRTANDGDAPGRAGAGRILHLDMDAFFASVELLRRPELAGEPVIVGGRGDPSRRGVVATATYEARRHGVHSGMPLRTAARLCPGAVFLPADFAEYARWSRRFKAEMLAVSPRFEDRGIDEAYLDIGAVPGESAIIGRDLKRRIREATGLTCSIGIAPNKLLAKICSDLDKPDGLTVLLPPDVPARIWPLPVRRIPGIGPRAEERLLALGIRTIGELAAVPLARLEARFGRAWALFLHDAAHGTHERPLVTSREPRSRSRETTFEEDVHERGALEEAIGRLAGRVADDLAARGYAGRTVGIKLRYADFETLTRDRTLSARTADAGAIRSAALHCLGRVALDRPVRLIGVRVTDLSRAQVVQGSLALSGD